MLNKKTKADLDALFQKHEDEKKAAKREAEKKESAEVVFVKRFYEVRDSVIEPALNDVAAYLGERGLEYAVKKDDDRRTGTNSTQNASIALLVYVGKNEERYRKDTDYPAYVYSCDKQKERVNMFERTTAPGRGGHAGGTGEPLRLEDITPDLVQSHVVSFVKQLL